MSTTALFAVGTETVEVGRFGMGLEEARKNFLSIAEGCGVKPIRIELKPGKLTFDFYDPKEDFPPGLSKLIEKVSNLVSISGDPPSTYHLELVETVKDGEYLRIGQYKD